jgi:PDZ domain
MPALAASFGLSLAVVAIAAEKPARDPDPANTRPLLKQLNEETQSLYHEVQTGVARVQLPPPKWAAAPVVADEDLPLDKWRDQLDPAVREALDLEQKRAANKGQRPAFVASVAKAATQPSTRPATTQHGQSPVQQAVGAWTISTTGDDTIILRPNPAGSGVLRMNAGGGIDQAGQIIAGNGQLTVDTAPGGSFTPNNIALLLDDQGHLLVPVCVEKESFNNQPVRVVVGQNQLTSARFVASDRQTNITLLKLDKPAGTPVKLADSRPAEGNLTMFLSPNSGVGRLIIWTNELRDWGVVVSMDGHVYGFTRQGQFLSAAGCKGVVQQLLAAGAAKRPKLGLSIAEILPDDATRQTNPTLGNRPAVRVEEVAPNSPAARAGLQQGDLITTVNDQPAADPSTFAAALATEDPKIPVKLTLLRDNTERPVSIQP